MMTPRERILAAIEHKPVDRIPMDYWGTPEATQKLMKELGVSDYWQIFKTLDIDKIGWTGPGYIGPAYEYHNNDIYTNYSGYWGVKTREVSYGDDKGKYYEVCYNPLEQYDTVEEIEANYNWPKADWFDFSRIAEQCALYPEYAKEGGYISPLGYYQCIRGLERSMIDMAADEEIAFYIIDKICDFQYEYHERFFEAAKGGIDIAQVTDDFGTQTGLMISLDMFDKYFSKQYKRFIKLVKDHGIKVFHHNDGSIMSLVPRLVELGIDVLNPIQWHLPGMDLFELKRSFGENICFHGGVDNQHVLPFGTVDEVRKEVITCLDTLASDGTGYIFAPCHNIQVNTPGGKRS